jgi:large subunit ribosomal protein L32
MKKNQRKAANRYKGVQATFCTQCGAPAVPHRVCPSCGMYGQKQVVATAAE